MAEMTRALAGLHPALTRLLEMLPPALAWVALTSPAWASVVAPSLLGFFLVAFSGYWLWRSCEFTVGLLIGLRRLHAAQCRDWLGLGNGVSGFGQLHHLVIVPTYLESDEVLIETLQCLASQTLPRQRIGVVLAFEERDPPRSRTRGTPQPAFRRVFRAVAGNRTPRSARRSQRQIVQPRLGVAANRS